MQAIRTLGVLVATLAAFWTAGTTAAQQGRSAVQDVVVDVVVLDRDGQLVAALGSPGGSAILAYNAKALVALLAWRLPLQQAIDLPNLYARGGDFYGEVTKFAPAMLSGLAGLGIEVKAGRGEESGLHGVVRMPDGSYVGAADPRREGVWREAGEHVKAAASGR